LYLDVGGSQGSTVCLKADSGETIWAAGSGEAGYASPFIATISGREVLILYKGEALVALDPKDGTELARYATTTTDFCNTATPPISKSGVLFISHTGEICPSGFLEIAAGNVRRDDLVDVYRHFPMFTSLRDPVSFGGRCGRCEFAYVCGGSRARAFAASGDLLGEDPLCTHDPAQSTDATAGPLHGPALHV